MTLIQSFPRDKTPRKASNGSHQNTLLCITRFLEASPIFFDFKSNAVYNSSAKNTQHFQNTLHYKSSLEYKNYVVMLLVARLLPMAFNKV